MKTLKNIILTVTIGLCLYAATPARAVLGETTTWYALTNLPTFVTGGATSNLFAAGTIPTNNVFSVRKDRGVSMFMQFAGTNAATTGTFSGVLAVTPDGTNWTTTSGLKQVATATGNTGVVEYTNFPPSIFNNCKKFTLGQLINGNNATNGVFPTNVWFSFSNP